jgi:hypothetical protein
LTVIDDFFHERHRYGEKGSTASTIERRKGRQRSAVRRVRGRSPGLRPLR